MHATEPTTPARKDASMRAWRDPIHGPAPLQLVQLRLLRGGRPSPSLFLRTPFQATLQKASAISVPLLPAGIQPDLKSPRRCKKVPLETLLSYPLTASSPLRRAAATRNM